MIEAVNLASVKISSRSRFLRFMRTALANRTVFAHIFSPHNSGRPGDVIWDADCSDRILVSPPGNAKRFTDARVREEQSFLKSHR